MVIRHFQKKLKLAWRKRTWLVSVSAPSGNASDFDRSGVQNRADKALYYSKQHGKNRITVASELLTLVHCLVLTWALLTTVVVAIPGRKAHNAVYMYSVGVADAQIYSRRYGLLLCCR